MNAKQQFYHHLFSFLACLLGQAVSAAIIITNPESSDIRFLALITNFILCYFAIQHGSSAVDLRPWRK